MLRFNSDGKMVAVVVEEEMVSQSKFDEFFYFFKQNIMFHE